MEAGPPRNYATLKDAITAHFEAYDNPDHQRFFLRQARQKPDKSVDVSNCQLRELASTCTLPYEDDEVRAQFIQGCVSSKLHERMLKERNMPMREILMLGHSKELSKDWAAHMDPNTSPSFKEEPVNAVQKGARTSKPDSTRPSSGSTKPGTQAHTCGWCDGPYPNTGACPASGKTCSVCSKPNHFSKVCGSPQGRRPKAQTKAVRTVEPHPDNLSDSEMDDATAVDVVRTIDTLNDTHQAAPMCHVEVQDHTIPALTDTGA